MKVPFVDLPNQTQKMKTEIMQAVESIVDSCQFVLGPAVSAFESEFAEFVGAKYGVGVGSGTDALHIAYRAIDLKPGEEVIVPAHTFVATPIGVTMAGGVPVPVEVDESTFLMDLNKVESAITSKTRAICPVHLYGRSENMEEVMSLAKKHNLIVIEDASQSHGSHWNGKCTGTFGDIGCYSLFPGKNLGAFGDAGVMVTDNEELKDKIMSIRNYGSPKKYHHPILGFNSRMDSMQAAILRIKLRNLKAFSEGRQAAAERYHKLLEGIEGIQLPNIPGDNQHVFHLYVIRTEKRDELQKHLQECGVGAGIHYPTPWHLQGAYNNLGYSEGAYPLTEKLSHQILSLPMFPEITEEQQQHVADSIKKFF
ncbi:MAG: DegT/DnrJ/EryC1/StrS family aminotransferase [Bdellovibrionales bacterium]|nr:DegT/DnrJ/EryC1/StrS family aminotransferase [Bdellovibrionales bacterium]